MKTQKIALALALFLSSGVIAQTEKFNSSTSTIVWVGEKIGGQHTGNIQLKEGNFEWKDGNIVSGEVVVDMTTITNTDLTDATYNAKLVGHLKSDDFFSIEKHPTATFKVTKPAKIKNGKGTLTGVITIKGKSETISFDVNKTDNSYAIRLEIDRSKFDVRYGSDSFFDNLGDKVIDDIFTLEVTLITT
ncbi:MAG: polyisoprenoid-binding protein YceI [Flavobacteriales bacterium]|jgi:polyisoprenoid-binding protein YceI